MDSTNTSAPLPQVKVETMDSTNAKRAPLPQVKIETLDSSNASVPLPQVKIETMDSTNAKSAPLPQVMVETMISTNASALLPPVKVETMDSTNASAPLPQVKVETMDFTNASAPLPQVKVETRLPPFLVETSIVKVEVKVRDAAKNENSVNGGGVESGEGSVAVNGGGGESGDVDSELTVRRKRGRPRKNPMESRAALPSLKNFAPKRGRLQLLAAKGRVAVDQAGGNFTPHVLTILAGEDIFGKILSVVIQMSPRTVCILSAVGVVAIVDICRAGDFKSGVIKHEGHFSILSLSGAFTLTKAGRKKGRLIVALSDDDASVFGGLVAGSIIAAVPTQIVLGSFKESKKTLPKTESAESSSAAGRFRVQPETVQLPEIEERFIVTPLSPHPNANKDVDRFSLQNSYQNSSEPSDYESDASMPDN